MWSFRTFVATSNLLLPVHKSAWPLLKITLIDIQPGAVKVLNRLIELMGIAEHVHQVFCMDVMEYHPDHSIDILIIEAMHHGLTREGHLHFYCI